MLDLSDVIFPPAYGALQRDGVSWIYVFVCAEYSKVGIAKDPIARLSTVAGSMPFDVAIWGAYRVPRDMAQIAEAFCHSKLAASHHRGEWFRVEPAIALEVVAAISALACKAAGARTAKLNISGFEGVPVAARRPRSRQFRASAEHFLDTCEKQPKKGTGRNDG